MGVITYYAKNHCEESDEVSQIHIYPDSTSITKV